MSTELIKNELLTDRIHVTRFWGGVDNGVLYRININKELIRLDKKEYLALIQDMIAGLDI